MRWIRRLIGVLMLPLCAATAHTLWDLLVGLQVNSPRLVSPAAASLAAGFALWVILYACLPRPVRTYVWAHELTHALWAWVFGFRVLGIRVRKNSGAVTLSDSNFLVTLAPYFFPLYTVLAIIAYYLLGLFYPVAQFELYWLGVVGFTWGFHLTFTLTSLAQHQPDIRECGHLFSYAVIFLMNVLGVCAWVVLVSRAGLGEAAWTLARHVAEAVAAGARAVGWLAGRLAAAMQ